DHHRHDGGGGQRMIDWLMAPIDGSRAHDVAGLMSWHARSMVVAWAVLVPLGVLSARYLKVTPWQDWPSELDNPTWWTLHRSAQYAAGGVMLLGLALVLVHRGTVDSLTAQVWVHKVLGWIVLAIAASQYLSAWSRGTKGGPTAPSPDGSLHGDHYDMTPRRRAFEWLHKLGGTLAIFISVTVILTGLWQLNAPRWMWLVLMVWWFGIIVAVALAERTLGAHDTYQAIWGPDAALPGNVRKPIGWRVRKAGQGPRPPA
ncbi:MAG: cytochrome b561 domain-containing protein, partial [Paracoccaceae bacterium]